jgi:HEAT repeat protein
MFMKRWLIPIALLAGVALSSSAAAHGGTYRGPGDTVPPGAGAPATPATPATPTTPATPSTPATPATPSTPSTPATPAAPAAPAPPTTQAVTPSIDTGPDLNRWEFWWEFNKGPFLNLKAKVQSGAVSTGESDIMAGLSAGGTQLTTFAPTPASIRNTIIPELRKLVGSVEDRDILGGGIMALAKIQIDPTVMEIFKGNLDSGDQEIAETSALAYGVLQAPEAYPMLEALADDSAEGRKLTGKPNGVPDRTRAFAIYGMGLLGSKTEDATLQQTIGDKLWTILINDQSSFKDLRTASIISMGVVPYQDPSVPVEKLLGYLEDANNDFLVRAHCPNAIAKILAATAKDDPSNPLIARAVNTFAKFAKNKHTKNEVEQSCVYSLGMLVNSSDHFPIDTAFDAISYVADKSKNKQAQRFSSIAMAYLGARVAPDSPYFKKAVSFLMDGLRKGRGGRDTWNGLSLGVMGFFLQESGRATPSTIERALLDKFNKEKNQQRRGAYAVALGLIRSEIAKEDIRESIDKNRDPNFQGYACLSLGMIGAREYKDDLIQIVLDNVRKPDLLKQASIALGLMKDKEVSSVLIGLIKPEDKKKPSLAVLSAAATALGFIGDKSTVTPLVDTMNNDKLTGLARAFSAIALGAVAEAYPLPWNSLFSVDLNYRASVQTLTNQATGILDIL